MTTECLRPSRTVSPTNSQARHGVNAVRPVATLVEGESRDSFLSRYLRPCRVDSPEKVQREQEILTGTRSPNHGRDARTLEWTSRENQAPIIQRRIELPGDTSRRQLPHRRIRSMITVYSTRLFSALLLSRSDRARHYCRAGSPPRP